jgi:hypothetical protein
LVNSSALVACLPHSIWNPRFVTCPEGCLKFLIIDSGTYSDDFSTAAI